MHDSICNLACRRERRANPAVSYLFHLGKLGLRPPVAMWRLVRESDWRAPVADGTIHLSLAIPGRNNRASPKSDLNIVLFSESCSHGRRWRRPAETAGSIGLSLGARDPAAIPGVRNRVMLIVQDPKRGAREGQGRKVVRMVRCGGGRLCWAGEKGRSRAVALLLDLRWRCPLSHGVLRVQLGPNLPWSNAQSSFGIPQPFVSPP